MIERLTLLLSAYPVVRYASISVLLISICAALLGVTLVLKRYSMIGDGLSHVAFGATAIATVLGLTTPIYITLPLTIISAVAILKIKSGSRIKGDSAIAMVSTASLAFGYLILNLVPSEELGAAGDACTTLFGSGILSIKSADLIICAILAALVLMIYLLFYNKIFAVTFDQDFASATGTRSETYNTIISVITATVIVVAMNMMGALLISALIIFPALSAMRLFKTFKSVTVCAAVISTFCAIIGTLISLLAATPIGPTVVVANMIAFACSYSIGSILSSRQ